MTKVLIAMCLILMLSLPEKSRGQTPSPGSRANTNTTSPAVKSAHDAATGQITVSGCLQPATGTGPYTLTYGTQSGAVNKGVADPQLKTDTGRKGESTGETTKETIKEAAMPTDYRISYELVGAAGDLKPHVGHKVEVTGSVSKADLEMMDRVKKDRVMKDRSQQDPTQVDNSAAPQTSQSTQADQKMAESAIKPVRLNVTSLKHVSPTCP